MSTCGAQESDSWRRVDVAVNSVMPAAIDVIIERGWVVLTEAVRWLIGHDEAVHRAPTARSIRALRTLVECRRRATEERTPA